ncbi:MAG: hypothetical protein R6U95_08455 [Bacteroidales bacterium]
MKFKKHTNISLLLIVSVFILGYCVTHNPSKNKITEEKDDFRKTVDELQKNFFKNYWEIEEILVSKLEKDGTEYFIENNYYNILGKFESTLREYCQICEQLNVTNQGGLLTSYLHVHDMKNVEKQYNRMQNDQNAFIYKDFHKYKDSDKRLESTFVSIKYDERVEEFANTLYTHVAEIESFIIQEWDSLLPPVIRVMLMNHDGPSPYNPNLNETYMAVKSMPLSKSKEIAGAIVHETFHLVNTNLLRQTCDFEIDWEMNSFKFLDEGYAQLIQSKFQGTYAENRKSVDEYSKEIVLDSTFKFEKLQTKWVELFSKQDVNIYNLAYSFAYFIEDKYGAKKHKALFLPTENVSEETWVAYAENFFGLSIDKLIEEWKTELIQK